jgi:4-hydroxy 2-oxovalerate aldolase
VGPGYTVKENVAKINEIVKDIDAVVFSLNFCPTEIPVDYVFMSNAKRYGQLADMMDKTYPKQFEFIFTSNVTPVDYKPNYVLNYESLLARDTHEVDNSLFLLLNFFKKIGVTRVYLAGIDGYKDQGSNYYRKSYELSTTDNNAEVRNEQMSEELSKFNKVISLNLITPSLYDIK